MTVPNGTVGTSSRGRDANAPLLAVVSLSLGESVDLPPPRQALELVLAGVLKLQIRAFEKTDRWSGDEHLPGLCKGCDAGDGMDRDTTNVTGLALDFTRVNGGADLQPLMLGAVANRGAATDGARRAVEECQEAIARGRDLQAAEAVELAAHAVAVACKYLLPRSIAQPHNQVRRAHDICHKQRGDDALSRFRRFGPPAHAGELNGHVRLVADDPRQVARRNVECLAAVHNAARSAFHLDLDPARQGHALMMVLASSSAHNRLNVLRPAPTRLMHLASDVNLAEDHHLHAHQRLRDEFVRLVERLAHDGHRARIRRGIASAMDRDERDDHDMTMLVILISGSIARPVGRVHAAVLQRSSLGSRISRPTTARGSARRTPSAVNQPSRKVMAKLGMGRIRTDHRSWADPLPGAKHEEVIYEITREQCRVDDPTPNRSLFLL